MKGNLPTTFVSAKKFFKYPLFSMIVKILPETGTLDI